MVIEDQFTRSKQLFADDLLVFQRGPHQSCWRRGGRILVFDRGQHLAVDASHRQNSADAIENIFHGKPDSTLLQRQVVRQRVRFQRGALGSGFAKCRVRAGVAPGVKLLDGRQGDALGCRRSRRTGPTLLQSFDELAILVAELLQRYLQFAHVRLAECDLVLVDCQQNTASLEFAGGVGPGSRSAKGTGFIGPANLARGKGAALHAAGELEFDQHASAAIHFHNGSGQPFAEEQNLDLVPLFESLGKGRGRTSETMPQTSSPTNAPRMIARWQVRRGQLTELADSSFIACSFPARRRSNAEHRDNQRGQPVGAAVTPGQGSRRYHDQAGTVDVSQLDRLCHLDSSRAISNVPFRSARVGGGRHDFDQGKRCYVPGFQTHGHVDHRGSRIRVSAYPCCFPLAACRTTVRIASNTRCRVSHTNLPGPSGHCSRRVNHTLAPSLHITYG